MVYLLTHTGIRVYAKAIFFGLLAVLFIGMVALELVGYRIGRRRLQREPNAPSEGNASIEAALFALLGLLVAFTFSGAQDRLAVRRTLIVQEADAIGTAYLRIDLVPAEAQPMLREEFRNYVDSRLSYYKKILNLPAAAAERHRSSQLQQQIWQDAVLAAGDTDDPTAALLLLPALNEMFDITTQRDAALRTHAPFAIFILLAALALSCAYVAGLGMSPRPRPSRLHVVLFAGALSITAYVILNLEFPRLGFARLDAMDAILYQLRADID